MRRWKLVNCLSVITVLFLAASLAADQKNTIVPDLTKIPDGEGWKLYNREARVIKEDDKTSILRMGNGADGTFANLRMTPTPVYRGEEKMDHQNETLRTIHRLRSTHGNFSDKEITDEDLRTILNAAVRAANSSARQCYSIVVMEDRELMKQVTQYAGSKALIFCVDYNRLIDTARYLGHTYDVGWTIWYITAVTDTILAAQTAAIAARSLGIDSLFTNGIHRGDPSRVYKLLKLPEKHCFPQIALILGYATKEPEFLKGRLSGAGVVHFGEYHRLADQELMDLVKQYDDPEKHLGLNQDWKEKGFDHYLDWFYKAWSRPVDRKRDTFHDILTNIQFLPDHTRRERNE